MSTPQEWQPISTAPKTGESILLGHGNSVWEDEWWDDELGGSGWMKCFVGGEHSGEAPTHWMPLPDPPKSEGVNQQ